jgi:hypothetical protein
MMDQKANMAKKSISVHALKVSYQSINLGKEIKVSYNIILKKEKSNLN